jgi:hypothetical protein
MGIKIQMVDPFRIEKELFFCMYDVPSLTGIRPIGSVPPRYSVISYFSFHKLRIK